MGGPSTSSGDGYSAEFAVTRPVAGVSVLAVNCELDVSTAPALALLLTQQLSDRPEVLVVDFAGCGFLGSSGLAALADARQQTEGTDVAFMLVGLTRTVARALQATGLISLFRVHPSLDEALTQLDLPSHG